jgi:hypothetical protein
MLNSQPRYSVAVLLLIAALVAGCSAFIPAPSPLPVPGPAAPIETRWTPTECPVAPLSAVTDTNIQNGYTCLTVTATVVDMADLGVQPPRMVLLLSDGDSQVTALWAGTLDGLTPDTRVKVEGAVVNLDGTWGLWIYRWYALRGEST